jgi:hypothetical protein
MEASSGYWELPREERKSEYGERERESQGDRERKGMASSWRPTVSSGGLLDGQREQEVAHGALEASTHLLPCVSMKKTKVLQKGPLTSQVFLAILK